VGKRDLNLVPGGDLEDGVGFRQRAGHRFLHEYVGSGLGGRSNHCQPIFHVAWSDCDQIRLLLAQHLSPVGIRALGARALSGSLPPLRVLIGYSDYRDVG
jgi:hypothetical protein